MGLRPADRTVVHVFDRDWLIKAVLGMWLRADLAFCNHFFVLPYTDVKRSDSPSWRWCNEMLSLRLPVVKDRQGRKYLLAGDFIAL